MLQKTFSTNYLGEAFGCDRATAVRILKGIEPDDNSNKARPQFTIATFAKCWERHRARNASNANDKAFTEASDTTNLTVARARVAIANAEIKERINAVARGEFCNISETVDAVGVMMSVMREQLLSVPGKMSDRVASHSDKERAIVFEILREEIYDVLTVMSTPETYAEAGRQFAQDAPIAPIEQGARVTATVDEEE